MTDEPRPSFEPYREQPDGLPLAEHLDGEADALWRYARDCDRWGLATEASEIKNRVRGLRVRAMIARAVAATGSKPIGPRAP